MSSEVMTDLEKIFSATGRKTFLKISLDRILYNYGLVKQRCAEHTEIIAVVKANAYGHGSVRVCQTLQQHVGCKNFAVAALVEGKELREAGITGMIQVLGIATQYDISMLVKYNLTPTVSDREFLEHWANYQTHSEKITAPGEVILELNTGLNRSGFNPDDLPETMKFCEERSIPLHSIMTHFYSSCDKEPCVGQLKLFLKNVDQYRKQGVKVHAACSGAIATQVGTDLDFVRSGMALYGLSDVHPCSIELTKVIGYKQALAWVACPTFIKNMEPGDVVGYDGAYICKSTENIATLPVGYADGFPRALSGYSCITDQNGSRYEIVGIVSMDLLTIKVNKDTSKDEFFYLLKDDLNDVNSSLSWAGTLNARTAEVMCRLTKRLPRVYELNGEIIICI